jgi:purine/pyrimidine-nucleoside phosphorylase
MSEFKNVTVQKEANIYFEGRVISTKLTFSDGSIKTLGVMLPGEYEFGTEAKEVMDILSGELDILLPGDSDWSHISSGMSFKVPENSSFQLKITTITNYCCSYL